METECGFDCPIQIYLKELKPLSHHFTIFNSQIFASSQVVRFQLSPSDVFFPDFTDSEDKPFAKTVINMYQKKPWEHTQRGGWKVFYNIRKQINWVEINVNYTNKLKWKYHITTGNRQQTSSLFPQLTLWKAAFASVSALSPMLSFNCRYSYIGKL